MKWDVLLTVSTVLQEGIIRVDVPNTWMLGQLMLFDAASALSKTSKSSAFSMSSPDHWYIYATTRR